MPPRLPITWSILEHPHLGEGDVVRVTETELLDRLRRLRQRSVQCARKRLGEQAKARIVAQMQTETIDRQFIDPIVTGEPPAIAAFWPVITVSGSEGSRDAQWVVVIKECAQAVPESSEAGSGPVEP